MYGGSAYGNAAFASTSATFKIVSVSPEAYVDTIETTASSVKTAVENPEAYIDTIDASASSIRTAVENPEAYIDTIEATATSVKTAVENAEAYTERIFATPITNRTSLELLDFTIEFDGETATYYTQWFREFKIRKQQHDLAMVITVAPQAQDAAATVTVQHDANGNGSVDYESNPIKVYSDKELYEVGNIPVSEEGYYRLKIQDYSGYNAITNINIGIVH